jgi:MoxR-like ATPase
VRRRGETVAEREPQEAGEGPHLALQLVLCGERPSLGGMCFDLAGVTEVIVGRGEPLAIAPMGPGAARVDVPDAKMSGDHVRIRLLPDLTAALEDMGSRNGTRLRGNKTKQAMIGAGDWFIAGRSIFRIGKVGTGDGSAAVLGERIAGAPLLSTFSPTLAAQFRTAAELAPSRVPLLLIAETGTGKEVLAHAIHALSGRAGKLVAVNCAALPETLVESELFGYRKGAFSEAREDRPGLVRAAADGTLLLDEIGDLPLGSQAKVLRVLQDGEVMSLGATTPVKVDVRVIGASQHSLEDLVREGRFRADLLGRLAGFSLTLPPLRERIEDLGLLIATMLERYAGGDAGAYRFTADACVELARRQWPLNVRELERVVQAAVELARAKKEIGVEHLGAAPRLQDQPVSGDALKDELVRVLNLHQGNISATARQMGKARMQIHRWMNQFGLRAEDFRPGGGV